MEEKSRKRKEWVKTAAIVFLTIMLILTFFSNTIMNYSLPEVAVQYVQSGSVTAKIRGTGVIESQDPYNVKIKQVRKVDSIEVSVGDKVEKGQLLCILSSEDSAELEAAKDALKSATLAYDQAILKGQLDGNLSAAGSSNSIENYKNQILAIQRAITAARADVEAASADVEIWEEKEAAFELQISITNGENANAAEETKAVNEAKKVLDAADMALSEAQALLDITEKEIALEESKIAVSGGDTELLVQLKEKKFAQELAVSEAEITQKTAQLEYDKVSALLAAKKAEADANKSITINNLERQLSLIKINKNEYNQILAEKQKILEEKEQELNKLTGDIESQMNLDTLYEAIVDAREEVKKLEAETEGSEIYAPIAGTIMAINVKSGLETPTDGILFNMQRQGEGYTMSFSVTNAQAQRLSVGDIAEPVNSWRYDNVNIVLKTIRPDPSNPAENKLLVFDVTGDNLVANQSINVSVGQKSATYDLVVPNSAIREDNNGKFILIVETKSTPLSNRYIASRVDVQVVASDDTYSAITGALYGWEYVITTSTKPVEAGQQVRLSEN